tara:strand:+ start:240 stop:662 length:423 start_codon:yes stop_codon:yes gene_type:complete
MAKQTGLGDYLAIDDSGGTARAVSNDVHSLSVTLPQELLDVTGLDKSAAERLAALSDGTFSLTATFNAAATTGIHTVLSAARTTARTLTYCVGGNSGGNPKLECEVLIGSLSYERAANGALTMSADLSLSNGTVPTWGTV